MRGIVRASTWAILLAAIGVSPAVEAGLSSECDVRVVNRRDVAFTIVWGALETGTGYVTYGTGPDALDQTACDVRDVSATCDRVGSTHFIEVDDGIVPETTYFVQPMADGGPFGEMLTVVSGPILPGIPPSDTIFGTVVLFDGTTPATGTFVCATIIDADGQPSEGQSTLECDTIESDEQGFWNTNLGNARTEDLQMTFRYTADSADQVLIEACGGSQGVDNETIQTSEISDLGQVPGLMLVVPPPDQIWCADTDRDGFGDPDNMVMAPTPPRGFVGDCSDCDDTQSTVNPGAEEICDGLDNDCNTEVDESFVSEPCDTGEAGVCAAGTTECQGATGVVCVPDTEPASSDPCDGLDNDCDGETDENFVSESCDTGEPGVCAEGLSECVEGTDQCLPLNQAMPEVCNGDDDDCDGDIDEDAVDATTWWNDGDFDGFGDPANPKVACLQPPGTVDNDLDCDDSRKDVNPDGDEICDQIDNDCNGLIDELPSCPSPDACRLRAVDQQSDSFRVVWGGNGPTTGYVMYGTSAGELTEIACDDRDVSQSCDLVDDTHFVTVTGLVQSSTYLVQAMVDGQPFDAPLVVNTGPALPLMPDPIFGPAVYSDGETPATGAYVCATLRSIDGAGSTGSSTPSCGLISPDDEGVWSTDLGNTRTEDLLQRFDYDGASDEVFEEACGGAEGSADQKVPTSDEPPSPLLVIRPPCVPDQTCDTGMPGICAPGLTVCEGDETTCVANNEPAASDPCDGLDNDCDGEVDEEFQSGACETGEPGVCAAGLSECVGGMVLCNRLIDPSPEVCNGLDDDCDLGIDEGIPAAPCDTGQPGVCAAGMTSCDAGAEICVPETEPASSDPCDGLDNDCDAELDEDFMPESCDTGEPGVCGPGRTVCDAGGEVCVPETEPASSDPCDGLDNDCDAELDEDFMPESCDTGEPGVCGPGRTVCDAGGEVCVPETEPASSDPCDGLDNDCDAELDEDFMPESCDTGEPGVCGPGRTVCDAGGEVCVPETEPASSDPCDGLDNDCDAELDEDFMPESCDTGEPGVCGPGRTECDAGGEVCVPETEPASSDPCDGLDNDCDAELDEDFVSAFCDSGELGICSSGLSECLAGIEVCEPLNDPLPEVCNGEDDDCNGVIDDADPPCSGGDCESLRVSKTVNPAYLRAPRTPGCFMDGEPTSLTFVYTGKGCGGSDNHQESVSCSGTGAGSDPVIVAAAGGAQPGSEAVPYIVDPGLVEIGEEFVVFTVSGKLAAFSRVVLSGGVEETNDIVTSCAEPLQVGDSFGSLTLVAYNDLRASEHEVLYTYEIKHDQGLMTDLRVYDNKLGVIDEGFDLPGGDPLKLFERAYVNRTTTNTVTVTGMLGSRRCEAGDTATVVVWRPPACEGDFPRSLHMTYTGDACESASSGEQVERKRCSGGKANERFSWIAVSDRLEMWEPGALIWYWGEVELGSGLRIDAEGVGREALDTDLYVTIYDARFNPMQTLMLPAPCGDSLPAGSRFGGLRVDWLEFDAE